jgi:hypothetical protein
VTAGGCGRPIAYGAGDLAAVDANKLPDLGQLPNGVVIDAGAQDAATDAKARDAGGAAGTGGTGGSASAGSGGTGGTSGSAGTGGTGGVVSSDPCTTNNGGCGDALYYSCENNAGTAPTCSDINECLVDNGGCGDAAYYACKNNTGTAPTCSDINECAVSGACKANSTCQNTSGGYACPCDAGFSGDGKTECKSLCEIAIANNTCDANALCSVQGSSAVCTGCKAGYIGDGHACTVQASCPVCGTNEKCVSTGTSTYGCACLPGYTGGVGSCTDINECTSGTPCGANTSCANTPGGFTCSCKTGFQGDPVAGCTDINECLTSNGGCGSATYYSCTNNVGAPPTCADINECLANNGGCSTSPMATCTNKTGAVASCACPSGYAGSGVGGNGCKDIDECSGGAVSACGAGATACANTVGSYSCACGSGYNGTGTTACTPAIDYCAATNVCTIDYPCQNLTSSYTCRGQFDDWPPAYSTSAFTANGNGTVTDARSGLLWQQSVDANMYAWANAKPYCGGLVLAGKGWRLPTRAELESIVDDTRYYPAIDPTAFPSTPPEYFWSSSPHVGSSGNAWPVLFNDGNSFSSVGASNPYRVRCVSSSATVFASSGSGGAPPGRYTVSAGTVKDNQTGLTWQQAADANTCTWANAKAYCSGLSLAGTGWRLPLRGELVTLVDLTRSSPAIDPTAFPSTPLERFWSSSPHVAASGSAWFVEFSAGYFNNDAVSSANRVRCVR